MPVTPRFRWSLATPLLVLAGLFAMHGLPGHQEAGGHAGMSMAAPMAPAAPVAASVAAPPPTPLLSGTMDPGPGMAMGLCLAVLLGGFVAWLLLARASRRTTWRLPRQTTIAVPAPRGRDPDPPSLHALSVYRC